MSDQIVSATGTSEKGETPQIWRLLPAFSQTLLGTGRPHCPPCPAPALPACLCSSSEKKGSFPLKTSRTFSCSRSHGHFYFWKHLARAKVSDPYRKMSVAQQLKEREKNLGFDALGSFNLTALPAVKEHQEKEEFCKG